jgi:23S rRNA pseudouridine1911/1915/1917 synthase
MEKEMKFVVKEDSIKQRLDKFLSTKNDDLSRTYIQKLIDKGQVTVNGEEHKSSYNLHLNDEIKIAIPKPEEIELKAEEISLDVIYEDDDLIVINKQSDLVVHPAPGHPSGTLVNALLYHCDNLSGISGQVRPGIVHRLDKDTTGVLVVAKNDQAHLGLSEQFKERETEKIYLTLAKGNIKHNKGKIDAAIGRDPKDRKKMAVTKYNSKKAISRFEVLERFGEYTWVKVKLETGRTHQIRVHMSYMGNPVVADQLYGSKGEELGATRQLLHAYQLGFTHPIKEEWMEFEAEIPLDMEQVLEELSGEG